MSDYRHLFFTHLFFRFLVFYLLICVIIIILCLWILLYLTTITTSVKGDFWGSGWQRVVMAKCQGKKKKEEEGFCTAVFHCDYLPQRLKCIKPLFKNTQLWSTMYVLPQEESSECCGKIKWVLLPLASRLLSLGVYSLSTAMVSEWTSIT